MSTTPRRRTTALAAALAIAVIGGALLAQRPAAAQTSGSFVSAPVFNTAGISFAGLEAAAQVNGATGVWAQDRSGAYALLVVNGPAFLKSSFTAAFPSGFSGPTAMTLVRAGTAPAPAPTAAPTASPGTSSFSASISQMIVQQTNGQRASNGGLSALAVDAKLTAAAEAYAAVVFQQDAYLQGSANPHNLDGQPADRATRAGFAWSGIAENIAVMSRSVQPTASDAAQTLMGGWMDSAGHRANILTPGYTQTGVGCVTGRAPTPIASRGEYAIVCVAMFGTPR